MMKAPSSPLTTSGYPAIRVVEVLQSIAPAAAIFSLLAD
jgi:hypothetical protein